MTSENLFVHGTRSSNASALLGMKWYQTDVYVELHGNVADSGKEGNWSTWWATDGGDSTSVLLALDRAGHMDAQVSEVQTRLANTYHIVAWKFWKISFSNGCI